MPTNQRHFGLLLQDSIYRVWKFEKIEVIPSQNGENRMGNIPGYDVFDLTKKGVLRISLADSRGVYQSVNYKLVNNALVLQRPDHEGNVDVQFKIKELTSNTLKLIMHLSYDQDGKTVDDDFVQLDFEAVEDK